MLQHTCHRGLSLLLALSLVGGGCKAGGEAGSSTGAPAQTGGATGGATSVMAPLPEAAAPTPGLGDEVAALVARAEHLGTQWRAIPLGDEGAEQAFMASQLARLPDDLELLGRVLVAIDQLEDDAARQLHLQTLHEAGAALDAQLSARMHEAAAAARPPGEAPGPFDDASAGELLLMGVALGVFLPYDQRQASLHGAPPPRPEAPADANPAVVALHEALLALADALDPTLDGVAQVEAVRAHLRAHLPALLRAIGRLIVASVAQQPFGDGIRGRDALMPALFYLIARYEPMTRDWMRDAEVRARLAEIARSYGADEETLAEIQRERTAVELSGPLLELLRTAARSSASRSGWQLPASPEPACTAGPAAPGERVAPTATDWEAAPWDALGFRVDAPHNARVCYQTLPLEPSATGAERAAFAAWTEAPGLQGQAASACTLGLWTGGAYMGLDLSDVFALPDGAACVARLDGALVREEARARLDSLAHVHLSDVLTASPGLLTPGEVTCSPARADAADDAARDAAWRGPLWSIFDNDRDPWPWPWRVCLWSGDGVHVELWIEAEVAGERRRSECMRHTPGELTRDVTRLEATGAPCDPERW